MKTAANRDFLKPYLPQNSTGDLKYVISGRLLRDLHMARLDFPDIAKALNYSRTTNIDPSPIKLKEGKWLLYAGIHKVHTSSYPFRVLYFYAATTVDDLRSASREISGDVDTHVVY